MATVIRQNDLIESVADALQYISYYHPIDFIQALNEAYEKEANPAAKDAMAQILINSRMCALGHRPLCQDTGIVTVFLNVGMEVQWQGDMGVTEMVNEGVRRAYLNPDNKLRASILEDPDGARRNTGDNTPSVVHYQIVPGDKVEVHVAAKGGGSEAKSKFAMLNPSDDLVDWVLKMVPTMGAGWCPPGMLGIGVGGTAEKAMIMAKEVLLDPVNIHELKEKGAETRSEELRLELFDKVNKLGIGAQGLGGLTTVLDVKVKDFPTHAANKPVAMIPNCAATRHTHFTLDGSGPASLKAPSLEDWPEVTREAGGNVRRVNLDTVTREEIKDWKPGDTLLLNGKMLTGRDAAHKKMVDMMAAGEELPVDLNGRFIYMLEKTGLMGMIGKAERGPVAIEAIRDNQAVYLMAVGGAAYLVAQAIKSSKVLGFPELGMEAIYEFEVEDMPVTVAVDVNGESVHDIGPKLWKLKIETGNL
jgi:fumarate hydratase class I